MIKELISETISRIEATEARDRGRKIDDKLRFDHAVRYILIELWKSVKTLPTSEVSINKRSGYYSENKRYRDPLLTYKQTMAVYKGLLKLGFIEVTKEGHFDRNLFQGKITRIVAKDELLERLLELEGHPAITVPNDLNKETILLRDKVNGKRVLKDYPDTHITERYRDNLKKINTCFSKHWFDLEVLDAEIAKLEKRISTDRNLRLANDKAQDVSVKRLTRKNPTMAAKFDEVRREE